MAKLIKQKYYSKKGEEKINCYCVYIPKEIINKVNFENVENIKIKVDGDKIVIEKE